MDALLSFKDFSKSELLENQSQYYDSLFKKINIYTNNVRLGIINENAKYIDRDIYLIEEEKQVAHDILIMLKEQLVKTAYERYDIVLDEGLIDSTKNFVNKVKNKAQNTVNNLKDTKSKITTAFNMLLEAIKKGFKTISELLKFFREWLFEKLSDTLSDSIEKLGLIGKGKNESEKETNSIYNGPINVGTATITESKNKDDEKSDKEDLANSFKKYTENIKSVEIDNSEQSNADNGLKREGEKDFFDAVVAATMTKVKEIPDADKVELNESVFSDLVNGIKNNDLFRKFANNAFVKKIQGNKVVRFLSMILIGIVSSIIVTQCLPVILSAITLALGATAGGTLVTLIPIVCRIIWSSRAVLKVFINRYKDWKHVKETGEDNSFITGKFLLDLLVQIAILAATNVIPMGTILGKIGGFVSKIPFVGDLAKTVGTEVGSFVGKFIGAIQDLLLTATEKTSSAIVGQIIPQEQVQKIVAEAFRNCGLANWFSSKFNYEYTHEETVTQTKNLSSEEHDAKQKEIAKKMREDASNPDLDKQFQKEFSNSGTNGAQANCPTDALTGDNEKYADVAKSLRNEIEKATGVDGIHFIDKDGLPVVVDNSGNPITDRSILDKVQNTVLNGNGGQGWIGNGKDQFPITTRKAGGAIFKIWGGEAKETISKLVADTLDGDLFPLVFSPFKRFKDNAILLSKSNASYSKKFSGNLGRGMVVEMTFKELKEKATNTKSISELETLFKNLKNNAETRVESDKEAFEKVDKINYDDNKLLVMYAKVEDENVPFFAFSYDAMKLIDCYKMPEGTSKTSKERTEVMNVEGLFSHLNIVPEEKHDTEVKDKIFDMLALYLQKAAVTMTRKYYLPIVKDGEKFVPVKEAGDTSTLTELYGMSLDRICEILNSNKETADGEFRSLTNTIFSGINNENDPTIEKEKTYVKDNIIPMLSEDTFLSKMIKEDPKYRRLKKWLYDDDGNFNKDVIDKDVESKLYRIMTSYSDDTTRSWKDLFKNLDDKKIKSLNIKALDENIWNNKSKIKKGAKELENNKEIEKEPEHKLKEIKSSEKRSTTFISNMIKRFDVDEKKSDIHKAFVKQAMKDCESLYKDGNLNEEILRDKYIAAALTRIFNSKKYRTDENFDEVAKKRISRAVNLSSFKDEGDKLKESLFNAYKLIKDKKISNEYRGLKEGLYGNLMTFNEFINECCFPF